MQTLIFHSSKTGYVVLGEKDYRKAFVFKYSAIVKLSETIGLGKVYSARLRRLGSLLEEESAYTQTSTTELEDFTEKFFEKIPDSITLCRTTIKEYVLSTNNLKAPISTVKKEDSLVKLIIGGWLKKSYKKDRLINYILLKASELEDAKFQIITDVSITNVPLEKVRFMVCNRLMWDRNTLDEAVEKGMMPPSGILLGGVVVKK